MMGRTPAQERGGAPGLLRGAHRSIIDEFMTESPFQRVLGRRDVLSLAFGAMIGWSWVLLTGEWTTQAGTWGAAIAFALGGAAMVFVALTYAELASALPHAGGEHIYSLRALGPLCSFLCSWSIVLGYVSVAAFEAVALPYALTFLLPGSRWVHLWTVNGFDVHLDFVLIGVASALFMIWVNVRGVTTSASLQKAVTVVIVCVGILFLAGVMRGGSADNVEPAFVDGVNGIAAVLIMIPIMFVGFDVIPQTAGEINLPARSIGRLIVLSVTCAILWYCLLVLGVGYALPAADRAEPGMTTALAAARMWGGAWASDLIIVGGIAGIVTTWNAFLIGSSRLVYSMAEHGMLPRALATLHPRYRTPYVAVIAIGLLTCVAPLFGRPVLIWLINAGSLAVVAGYALVALSFLVLRMREPGLARPYSVRHWRLVGGLAFLLCLALSCLYFPGSPAALNPEEWLICGGWALLGWALHRRIDASLAAGAA
jgi:basic amino acid/polyamine antiporter, APA family